MKIIFLDVDGVLTSPRTGWRNWDIYAVSFLRHICEKYDIKIVISSGWRNNSKRDKQFFADILGDNNLHQDWKLKCLIHKYEQSRKYEIEEWLLRNYPNGSKFCVLDDDYVVFARWGKYLIQTKTYEGMGFEDMEKILEFFEIKDPVNMNLVPIHTHPNMFAK